MACSRAGTGRVGPQACPSGSPPWGASEPLQAGEQIDRGDALALAAGPALQLDLALGEAAGADDDLPGQADEVGRGELGARALVAVVVEHAEAGRLQGGLDLAAGGVGGGIAGLEVDQRHVEGRHRVRPDDAGLVVARLDDRRHEAARADAVGAHMDRALDAVGAGDLGAHRLGILGAEVEDVPDLDAARGHLLVARHLGEGGRLVHLGGGGVERGPAVDGALQRRDVLEIGGDRRDLEVEVLAVAVDLALAGLGQDDELVAEVAADRTRIGPHRDRLQAEAREGAQVGHEHPVVGVAGGGLVDVEGIGVLHQELARAHGAEARPDLVAELPGDLVEVLRQVLVGAHAAAEDLGDDLLGGGAEQHLAVVTVRDAEHLLAVGLVAAGFPPELGRLDRRHQDLDGPRPVLLLADHRADLVQDAQAQRQPRIDAGGLLAHEPGAQHEAVRDDLGLLGRLAQGRQEVAGETHGRPWKQRASGSAARPAHNTLHRENTSAEG